MLLSSALDTTTGISTFSISCKHADTPPKGATLIISKSATSKISLRFPLFRRFSSIAILSGKEISFLSFYLFLSLHMSSNPCMVCCLDKIWKFPKLHVAHTDTFGRFNMPISLLLFIASILFVFTLLSFFSFSPFFLSKNIKYSTV